MLTLMLASFLSWVMMFQRRAALAKAKKAFKQFEDRFWSGVDLGQLYREANASPNLESGAENLFRAGLKEFTRLTQSGAADPEVVMNGVQRAMRVAMSREEERLERHVPFLATVGSTSPYVGLFGTVWGIMNAFRGLANVGQATLAQVAPGIAEALIATAMGLFAAIPAVIAYNRFAAKVDRLSLRFESFMEEFINIVDRKG